MSNEITILNITEAISSIWVPGIQKAREQVLAAYKTCFTELFGKGTEQGEKGLGNTAYVNIVPNLTAQTTGSDGSITNQTVTITQTTVTVDQPKHVAIEITDMAKIQSQSKLLGALTEKMGYALYEAEDTFIHNLSDSASIAASHIFGAADQTPDAEAALLAALKGLNKAKVPKQNRWGLVGDDLAIAILGKDKFVSAFNVPYSKSGSPIVTGELPPLYGFNMVYTTNVQSGGTNIDGVRNLFLGQEWAAFARQKDVKFEQLARTKLTTPLVTSIIYGGKLHRADHIFIVKA